MNTRIRASAHPFRALVRAGLIASLAAVLIAGTALAGKPGAGGGGGGGKPPRGGSGTSSLAVVMVTDANRDGVANFNDTITFNVSTTATAYPYLDVTCTQGGTLVYSASAGFYDSYPWPGARNMPLYSPSWVGGAADCTAVLNTTLATLKFHVNG
jgi:hypothetical protein